MKRLRVAPLRIQMSPLRIVVTTTGCGMRGFQSKLLSNQFVLRPHQAASRYGSESEAGRLALFLSMAGNCRHQGSSDCTMGSPRVRRAFGLSLCLDEVNGIRNLLAVFGISSKRSGVTVLGMSS